MDIGTGKDLAAYGRQAKNAKRKTQNISVSHHLIDVVSPKTQFTVAKYQRLAYRAIDDILRRRKLPIICGGTWLYVDAVVQGYQLPEFRISNFEFRKLREQLSRFSLPQLLARLKSFDRVTFNGIDLYNRRRVQRALEIYYASGKTKSEQLKKIPPAYDFLQLGVAVTKPVLYQRILRRLRKRFYKGMNAEVRRLHQLGISWQKLDAFGLEYRWISRYLNGKISRQEMEQQLLSDIKHYARRQMTWFRRNCKIHWIITQRQANTMVQSFLNHEGE